MNGPISDVLALMFQPEAGADIDRKAVASIHRDEPDNRGEKGGQPLCGDIFIANVRVPLVEIRYGMVGKGTVGAFIDFQPAVDEICQKGPAGFHGDQEAHCSLWVPFTTLQQVRPVSKAVGSGQSVDLDRGVALLCFQARPACRHQ